MSTDTPTGANIVKMKLEEMASGKTETQAGKRVCFVISPIGQADSDTRKRADQILKHVIRPAVQACGYDPVRADGGAEPGMITGQVIQHMIEDPLVVADLTDRHPNVFYALALRHALKKPLVQVIQKGQQTPFDLAGSRLIQIDHRDLDSVEGARREIIGQIQALEKNPEKQETPISMAIDLKALQRSGKPFESVIADMVENLRDVKAGVVVLQNRSDELMRVRDAQISQMTAELDKLQKALGHRERELARFSHLEQEWKKALDRIVALRKDAHQALGDPKFASVDQLAKILEHVAGFFDELLKSPAAALDDLGGSVRRKADK